MSARKARGGEAADKPMALTFTLEQLAACFGDVGDVLDKGEAATPLSFAYEALSDACEALNGLHEDLSSAPIAAGTVYHLMHRLEFARVVLEKASRAAERTVQP